MDTDLIVTRELREIAELDIEELQNEIAELNRELDRLEVKYALLMHKASRGFFERQH